MFDAGKIFIGKRKLEVRIDRGIEQGSEPGHILELIRPDHLGHNRGALTRWIQEVEEGRDHRIVIAAIVGSHDGAMVASHIPGATNPWRDRMSRKDLASRRHRPP